jgi:hypothetical protein
MVSSTTVRPTVELNPLTPTPNWCATTLASGTWSILSTSGETPAPSALSHTCFGDDVAVEPLVDDVGIKSKQVPPLEIRDSSLANEAAHMTHRHAEPICRLLDVHKCLTPCGYNGRGHADLQSILRHLYTEPRWTEEQHTFGSSDRSSHRCPTADGRPKSSEPTPANRETDGRSEGQIALPFRGPFPIPSHTLPNQDEKWGSLADNGGKCLKVLTRTNALVVLYF